MPVLHANLTTRDVLRVGGASGLLRSLGVELDPWDQLLTLAELAAEYDIDPQFLLDGLLALEDSQEP